MMQDKAENLKMKLKSVSKLKLRKAREEFNLRNTEHNLSEELRTIQAETEFMFLQLEDLKQELSSTQYQIAMIGICEASEECKIKNHIVNITYHKSGYEQSFLKDNEAMELNKMRVKKKEEEEQELNEQKQKKIEEKNQFLLKEAVKIEKECDAIEQECAVLKKRNKAIMLKLRRKLIESEELRRSLMKTSVSPAYH